MSADNSGYRQEAAFVAHRSEEGRSSTKGMVYSLIACILVPLGIAFGVGTQHEMLVVAGVFGIVCLALGMAYPFWGLVIFVGLLYTRPEEAIPALAGMHFSLVASVVTTISVIFQKLMDREAPVKAPVNAMILGFGLVVVLTTFSTGDMGSALMDIGKLIALYLMIINLINTPSRYRILVAAIMLCTVYLSGFSIYEYFSGGALKREGTLQALGTGIFGDPNDLSATICAGLGFALTSAVRAANWQRLVYILLSGFMVAGIYFTNSRGGMIAMCVVLAAFTFLYMRAKWVAVVLAVLIAGGALKFGPSRMTQLDASEESANSRFRFWSTGVQAFTEHPVLGVGYLGFDSINNGRTAHNTFVLCFTELGLAGYFFWTGCIYYGFRGLKRAEPAKSVKATKPVSAVKPSGTVKSKTENRKLKIEPRPPDFSDILGARLALAGFLMAGFWISRTYVPVLFLLLALPVAQQIAFSNGQKEFTLTNKQKIQDWVLILVICLASIAFIYLLSNTLKG